ncbi:MAG: PSD1 and planctomycete cytochrome C domain-containing protein [Limisphaerales bacterium]
MRRTIRNPWPGLLALTAGLWLSGARAAAPVSFNRDIRPILSDHCFACHGPDEKTRKAGLRLDLAEEALKPAKSGKPALVTAQPDASELVARVLSSDPDEVMPPPELKKPLKAEQIELLRRWIAEGAKYEGHWAYLAPQRPEPPEIPNAPSPIQNAIDAFVQARLEAAGLKPSPEAPKEKLLRRASLDLTGLPPTVEELDAFLNDSDPKAYEKAVDRLLASPHYGERMAQFWLDLARYGETQGYHHDRHRDLWRWRDWVIKAFNDNVPFDTFTTEQLAGDLLPNPTRDQLVATGFHRNEMTTSEGGALPEEYLVKYAVGRVDTTARVWLGTSLACAECHDHKYDPISQREFYRFYGFFNQVAENGLDAEELNAAPRLTLETPEQREKLAQLGREAAALEAAEKFALGSPRAEWDAAQQAWETRHREGSVGGWADLKFAAARVTTGGELAQRDDGFIGFGAAVDGVAAYEVTLRTDAAGLNSLRLEMPGDAVPAGRAFLLTQVEASARAVDPAAASSAITAPELGGWHSIGPFPAGNPGEAFDKVFGPENGVDLAATFLDGKLRWTAQTNWADGEVIPLDQPATAATYLARTITSAAPQVVEASLGSDDGLQVWLNGRRIHANKTDRPAAADQDKARLWLRPGENRLLLKVSNGAGGSGFYFRLKPGALTDVALDLAAAGADRTGPGTDSKAVLESKPDTGWSPGTNAAAGTLWLRGHEAFGFAGGTELRVRLHFDTREDRALPGRFRIAARGSETLGEFLDLPEATRATLAAAAPDDAQRADLRKVYRQRHVGEVQQTTKLLADKRREREAHEKSFPTAMVMRDLEKPRPTHVLVRGEYHNPGEAVTPGVPEKLFEWRGDWPANRLGLAKWLLDPSNPLTARVVVNQYWQKYFGTGLVKTAEEFGAQGEWPSHPELLDWLASEFVRNGWDIKDMQRLIVTSHTYRQDSRVTLELLEKDPENRLLARGPRHRVEAEGVRDIAMTASGLLNPKVGGPSVFPYQPPGLWGQVAFEGTPDYVQSAGDENYRRGLYTYWRRSIPYSSFTVFDAPTRETCIVRRPRTNTPLQALNLLNDPVYVEAARAFAHRILKQGGASVDGRLDYAFRVALSRRPADAERARLAAAVARELERFAADRTAANQLVHVGSSRPPVDVDIVELAAWTVLANTLLNLDETITKG